MGWLDFGPRWARRNVDANATVSTTADDASDLHSPKVVVAAAQAVNTDAVRRSRTQLVGNSQSWQIELWDYFESCGEYGLAVNWRSNMISRVRLRAAEILPGLDEPKVVDTGPAADLVNELFTDVGGQSAAMATLSTYLDVPGEGWIVGERRGRETWRTYSSDEIRGRGDGYEVIDGGDTAVLTARSRSPGGRCRTP